jgi:hypothetical protein
LVPLANTFYLRSALLEAGGWHPDAEARLKALGYEVKFEETLHISRAAERLVVAQ